MSNVIILGTSNVVSYTQVPSQPMFYQAPYAIQYPSAIMPPMVQYQPAIMSPVVQYPPVMMPPVVQYPPVMMPPVGQCQPVMMPPVGLNINGAVISNNGCLHYNTSISTSYSASAWIWFIILLFVCPILSFLPFCLEDCMDRITYCRDCGRRL
ncbi:hypothetical protein SteCoe_19627 [Stentor coeruleus]|uniref:LITAF domain-containing protein n=1 Tax=Stentor coeruleus TaxID=5963 RepID=A0A1R2BTU4_9CILI|nr:hypothetical protein SteCoe_19627 [Stentor coeruleus]